MTSYTYDPVIGITAGIDANNRITSYEYDDLQRLRVVRDQDSNAVKKYEYKYANPVIFYNTAKSGIFQRLNCTPCLVGSNVTYTVPANTYTSTFDQEEADQLAIDRVAFYGPHYADSAGTCSPPPTAPITGHNSLNGAFDVTFINTCTGTNYSFTIASLAGGFSLSGVPQGHYTVEHASDSGITNYTFHLQGIHDHTSTGFGSFLVELDGSNIVAITL